MRREQHNPPLQSHLIQSRIVTETRPFLPANLIFGPQPTQALSFIVDQEISQAVPVIALHIDVIHTTPEPALHRVGIPPKEPHHATPTQRREDRPRIVPYPFRERGGFDEASRRLYRELC